MCNLLASGILICNGIIGYAGPLDAVAERRYVADWGGLGSDPSGYEALLGMQDCAYLGRTGYLIAGDEIYTVMVADCNQRKHPWPSPYYLGDVNRRSLNCKQGWLILGAEQ